MQLVLEINLTSNRRFAYIIVSMVADIFSISISFTYLCVSPSPRHPPIMRQPTNLPILLYYFPSMRYLLTQIVGTVSYLHFLDLPIYRTDSTHNILDTFTQLPMGPIHEIQC